MSLQVWVSQVVDVSRDKTTYTLANMPWNADLLSGSTLDMDFNGFVTDGNVPVSALAYFGTGPAPEVTTTTTTSRTASPTTTTTPGSGRPYRQHAKHYCDVIMGAMASQITSIAIVYSTVYSGADQKKTYKLRVTGLFAGEFIGDRWIPRTNDR